jgi:hypothetical protein
LAKMHRVSVYAAFRVSNLAEVCDVRCSLIKGRVRAL